MGYGTNHEEHGGYQADPSQLRDRQEISRFISDRVGPFSGHSADFKDVASEVSRRYGVVLTPSEVKDIHRGGW